MRDKSSDCTLSSGGAVASGFAREIFGAEAGFEALGCFNFFGFGVALHLIQRHLQAHSRLSLEPRYE